MASRQRAYSALRQDLAVVCANMREEAATGKGEEAAKCKGYLRKLRSLNFKQALHFMIDALNILADVSCAFQKDDLLITDIAVKLGGRCLKLNALRQLYSKVFAEYTASEETSPTEMQKADLCDFVDKVVAFVETRFQFLKQTPFSNFQVFDYRDHPSTNEEEFASYSNVDIVAPCQNFEGILGRDANDIIGQWPELKMLLSRKRKQCPFETYTSLMAETPEVLVDITLWVRLMFNMSPSTAACERGFRAMNAIMNIRRMRMSGETLSTLMCINAMSQTLKEVDPTPAVKKWLYRTKNPQLVTQQ